MSYENTSRLLWCICHFTPLKTVSCFDRVCGNGCQTDEAGVLSSNQERVEVGGRLGQAGPSASPRDENAGQLRRVGVCTVLYCIYMYDIWVHSSHFLSFPSSPPLPSAGTWSFSRCFPVKGKLCLATKVNWNRIWHIYSHYKHSKQGQIRNVPSEILPYYHYKAYM